MINVPDRMHSSAQDGILAGANEIFDDEQQMFQSEINKNGSNKAYDAADFSGMGRVNLPKNIQTVVGVEKNLLTQDMFYKGEVGSRVPNTNTIFVIQYDYTLGEDITVPANCVLEFDGGSISGEHTVIGNNTGINAGLVKIFSVDITLTGTFNCELNAIWFGLSISNSDNSTYLEAAIKSASNKVLRIEGGVYNFTKKVTGSLRNSIIYGNSHLSGSPTILKYNTGSETPLGTGKFFELDAFDISIKNLSFLVDYNQNAFCAIRLKDGISAGEIDAYIENCYISKFGKAIEVSGRGIKVDNCLLTSLTCCLSYIPAKKETSDPAQLPPYDGRGIVFTNNRCHGIDYTEVSNGAAVLFNFNESIQTSSAVGFLISGNILDNTGSLLKCNIPVIGGVITNNVLLKSIYHAVDLRKGADGLIISNNVFSKHLNTMQALAIRDIFITSSSITVDDESYIPPIKNVSITSNDLEDASQPAIYIGSPTDDNIDAENISIVGNVAKNVKQFLFLRGLNYQNITCISNACVLTGNDAPISVARINGTGFINDLTPIENNSTNKYRVLCSMGYGTTSNRTSTPKIGDIYFDTTISPSRPVWWNGTAWVDATGATV